MSSYDFKSYYCSICSSKSYYKTDHKKIKEDKFIQQIKNDYDKPIDMKLFLSFLTVSVEFEKNIYNGYGTYSYFKGGNDLIITFYKDKLDNIEYGKKLHNSYNNSVNAFYIFEILNDVGKLFFMDYYNIEIEKIYETYKVKIDILEQELNCAKEHLNKARGFLNKQYGETNAKTI